MAAPSSKVAAETASKGISMGGKVFFGSLCAGTFGLGVWQIERYFEKITLMDDRAAQLAMEPTTNLMNTSSAATGTSQQTEQGMYRRRNLHGVWRHDREVLIGPRGAPAGVQMPLQGLSAKQAANSRAGGAGGATSTSSGMAPGPQGFHVLTPLQLSPGIADRQTVWVNRGWIPKKLVPGAERSSGNNRNGSPVTVAQEAAEWASYPAWNREDGPVTVTTIQSKVESKFNSDKDEEGRNVDIFFLVWRMEYLTHFLFIFVDV
jgi:cytochrome oxidase assembly protein ShyY1